VLPAGYRVDAKTSKAERTDRYHYESGASYEVTYELRRFLREGIDRRNFGSVSVGH
jgi:hypothetical protein